MKNSPSALDPYLLARISDLRSPTSAPFRGASVLVTGGAGFIGSHLVERLCSAGAAVTVLDNLQAGKWENLQKDEGGDLKPEGWKAGDGGRRSECRGQMSGFGSGETVHPTEESEGRGGGRAEEGERDDGGNRKPESQTADHGPQTTDFRSLISDLRCIEGDVRDAGTVAKVLAESKPAYVFHLAANASVPGSVEDPAYDFESNCLGTFRVLDACRHMSRQPRIVVASSGAVYGEPDVFPITERSVLKPISPYGASKLGAEDCARMFARVYGVPVVIGRLFNTYGPRMPRFVVFDFLRKLQKDADHLEILGSGKQVRDLNYVADTVQGFLVLALRGTPGEEYNIASGRSHTVTEIALMLLEVLGLRDQTRMSFTGESWEGDAQRWEVDVGKLRGLGYEPGVSLEDGLRRVAQWFESVHGTLQRGEK